MRADPVDIMKDQFVSRVASRKDTGTCYVDLRTHRLRGERVTLRNPDHPDWPDRGRTTRSKVEARMWARSYVDRLGLDWCRGDEAARVTVEEWGEAYLESILSRKGEHGPTSSKYMNYRNYLRNHWVLPRFRGQVS